MKIKYQGEMIETAANTLSELLAEKEIDPSAVIIEADGEIHARGTDFSAVALKEGGEVNLFRVVAGG